ncbi:NAD(P)-binding protein [Nadsonia fulvescens var. elongata DSM 6958]|uniref:NAD(P)-binding protein n=1 Tax=Nadsonia fulvescens var. elongata DSM 6958 TaxID=857566 RepID=A0A1E3PM71_9ASCO|nr:NAD(P)-binding protein [Nadsonia fulvescens var. elongata DSM 6958]
MLGDNRKVALITGASSGIGKSLAIELNDRGIHVLACARRVEEMQDLAKLGIETYKLDVTNQQSVEELQVKVVSLTGGKLDYLFNNAGQPNSFPVTDIEIDDARATFEVNVFGVMRMVKVFTPLLIEAKGKIINTGSLAGVLPIPFSSVYNSSKAALHQYSRTIKLELEPFGVDVITTITGGVRSNISEKRLLPADSMFMKYGEESINSRRNMSQESSPMEPAVYAKSLANQVLKANTNSVIWEGSYARIFWFVSTFLPASFVDFIFVTKFKVNTIKQNFSLAKKTK